MSSEHRRLEEQIELVESQLKQLPKGKLICKRDDKRYKWYYNKDGKQIYIPKKERQFAEKLAARKYLEHLHEDLVHEKMAIEFYIRHHKEGTADKMLTQMPEYQELLKSPIAKCACEWYNVGRHYTAEWHKSPTRQGKNTGEKLWQSYILDTGQWEAQKQQMH